MAQTPPAYLGDVDRSPLVVTDAVRPNNAALADIKANILRCSECQQDLR